MIITIIPFYLYLLLFIIVFLIGIIGFIFALRSRKVYKCPLCGESFRAENMTPKTCKVCGGNLEKATNSDVTDSAI